MKTRMLRKAVATTVAATMVLSVPVYAKEDEKVTIDQIELGKDYTDIKADLKFLTHKTDVVDTVFKGYVEEFQKLYPNVNIEYEGITDYANDVTMRLSTGDWGDICMVPTTVDKDELENYFVSFGDKDSLSKIYESNMLNNYAFGDQVYGLPSMANVQGIVYNKAVFKEAGITELPKTPDEFLDDLQKIKDNTDAIPLYTNFAAGWTMTAWDDYIGATSTGDKNYKNNVMLHTSNPFSDTNDGTHPYSVYKVLYDAVANGYTEDDFSTTDWETSKTMLNQGKIGCMALGSWSYLQMQQAGPNASDIGYMAFPISVNGKQYVTTSPNYKWGINVKSSEDNQKASMVFVKWLTEKSKFAYNEGGLPIKVDDNDYPEAFQGMVQNNVEFITDEPAVSGEESLLNDLNADSELMISAGKEKIQAIIEHAAKKDESFDDIMKEWNEKWTKAQESNNVTVDK